MIGIGSLFREAVRNTRSGTSRFGLSVAALVSTVLLSLGLEVADIWQLRSQADAFSQSGASIQTVRSENNISGAGCEALNVGTVRAGALRSSEAKVSAAALPGSTIPTFFVSLSFARMVIDNYQGPDAGGVLISRQLADSLGLEAGEAFHATSGQTNVLGVFDFPQDGRRSDLGYAILQPSFSVGTFDECWASSWPNDTDLTRLLSATQLPSGDDAARSAEFSQVNSTFGRHFNGYERFITRLTRAIPVLVVPATIAITALLGAMRKLEYASLLHVGFHRRHLWLISVFELGFVIAAGAIIMTPLALAVAALSDGLQQTLFEVFAGTLVAGSVGVLIGSGWIVLSIREDKLFQYFKER